eukprot:4565602-Amphidinium_carterae.1
MPWSSLPWCCLVAVFGIGLGNLPECQSPNDVATRTFRQLKFMNRCKSRSAKLSVCVCGWIQAQLFL